MSEKSNQHFDKAKENLKVADKGLFKPEEDVVTYLICKNSQYAIENNLKGFLTLRGFETHDHETLEGLLKRCIALDSKFKNVDLQAIDCKAHQIDSSYCDDVHKVSSCFKTADDLDTFLRKLNVIQ